MRSPEMESQAGFSLLEVLVALTIFALIASTVLRIVDIDLVSERRNERRILLAQSASYALEVAITDPKAFSPHLLDRYGLTAKIASKPFVDDSLPNPSGLQQLTVELTLSVNGAKYFLSTLYAKHPFSADSFATEQDTLEEQERGIFRESFSLSK